MNFPEDLKYSKSHEWIRMLDTESCLIGITDFAQSELGDLVFINLPKVGDEVVKDSVLCDVESVKTVSDVMTPVTGTITEINEGLVEAPQKLNDDPFGAWIAKIEHITAVEELMNAAEYEAFCKI